MSLSNSDLLALKQELTNDPKSLGLTLLAADDEANANKLNAVSALLPVKKRALTTAAIFNCIAAGEHQALSPQQARWLDAVLTLGQIDPFINAGIVDGLQEMFSEQTASRPNIDAALVQPGSRVSQLYQGGALSVDVTLTPSDIAQARSAT